GSARRYFGPLERNSARFRHGRRAGEHDGQGPPTSVGGAGPLRIDSGENRMGTCKRGLRFGAWALFGLGAGGVYLAGSAQAQPGTTSGMAPAGTMPAEPQKKKVYTNKSIFHLPVVIDPKTRANLREIRLYVKQGAADWVRQEAAQPNI